MASGSRVLVERDGRVVVRFARLPILLDKERTRWRRVKNPGSEQAAWVSDKGQIAWTSPATDEILTVEEKLGYNIASPDEVYDRLNSILEKTLSSATEREIFNLFNHGVLAEVSGQVVASALRVEGSSAQEQQVSSNGEKETHKYITATDEEEKQMNDSEAMAELLAVKQLATETVTSAVLTEGSEKSKRKWISGLEKELQNMNELEVWTVCHQDKFREHFQLDESESLPAPLPMKLVLTKKPIMDGGEQAADTKAGASENAEEAELDSFKARCRLVACGNFEGTPGDDLSSQNIDATALRYFTYGPETGNGSQELSTSAWHS